MVNARVHAGGNVTAALVDAETLTPLAGRAAEDCRPMNTDAIAGPIRWKNCPHAAMPDRPFRIRFYVTGAYSKLFGFSWESSG